MYYKFISAIVGTIIATTVTTSAEGAFQVTLNAGGASTTIADGGAGDFDGSQNSIISISTVVGGWQFKVTLATTNVPGTPLISLVQAGTNEIVDQGGGPGSVSIYASANNFTSPVTPPPLVARTASTLQVRAGTRDRTIVNSSVTSYLDASNAMSTGPSGTVIGSASATATAPLGNVSVSDKQILQNVNAPYALNLQLSATTDRAGAAIDLDGAVQLSPVPEPVSIAVWSGLCLLGLGIVHFRRTRFSA